MTNLPITVNNSQPSAKGAPVDASPPRSGSAAVTANTATSATKNDAAAQPADPFGAVLARRIQADEANTADPSAPPASGIDAKITADSAVVAGKTEQDKIPPTADIPNDPSSILATMLQLPHETRPLAAQNAIASTADKGIGDAVATIQGLIDAAATAQAMPVVAVVHGTGINKSDTDQLAANAGVMQGKAKFGMATATSGKADAAAMTADNSVVIDKKPALRPEITMPVELPASLPDAARSAQGLAQTAASTSGILPNMLTNDKAANGLQAISSPLGSSGWANEFSQKITWMGTQQNQVAELHLNPPNLGPLDVVLKISDNQATALFTSPHSAVRDAVESALPRLREMLADNGITLGNTMVSDQSPRDRSTDGFVDHGTGTAAQREASGDTVRTLSPTATQTVPMRRHNGMVDTFA